MLKIRVWDSIKKKFITNKKCIIDNLEKDDENNSIELNSAGRYIFLKYIVQEDKNGRDIYEGDIVKFEDCSIGGKDSLYNIGVIQREGNIDEIAIGQLLYEETVFSEQYIDYIEQTFEVCEVIGNIYENSDLLKNNI